jgi:acetylxylan esterase
MYFSTFSNDYYSQCLPGTATTTKITTTSDSNPSPTTTPTTSAPTSTAAPPAGPTPAAGYSQMSNFGSNPNNVPVYVYKPKTLASSPALILAIHYCTGTAQAYYQGTQYANLAEQKGM